MHSVCLLRIGWWPLVLKADDVHACKAILFSSAAGLLAALFVFPTVVFPETQHVPSKHSCIHTFRARAAESDDEAKPKDKEKPGMPLPLEVDLHLEGCIPGWVIGPAEGYSKVTG